MITNEFFLLSLKSFVTILDSFCRHASLDTCMYVNTELRKILESITYTMAIRVMKLFTYIHIIYIINIF